MDDLTGTSHAIDGARVTVTEHLLPEDFEDMDELTLLLESGEWPSCRALKRHFSGDKERRGSVQRMNRMAVVRLSQEEAETLFPERRQRA